jgi:uncharacterized delta-60 repeat protein
VVTRNRIARLNPDGTLDTSFDPNANGIVRAIALQADGKILAGGDFNGANSIGGQTRNRIARLDATTGAADSFDPNADAVIRSIALQADGKILAGGSFASIGGQTRNRIARLDATTGLADAFNPDATGFINSIVVQADGKILLGGIFSNVGGQVRNGVARLDPVSGLADSFSPSADDVVNAIALQADGKILVGGFFNSVGGQSRSRIARLDPVTGLADSFNPNANNPVNSIAVQPDGKILAGGIFNIIGGQARGFIARLDSTTGMADSFNPSADNTVFSIAVQADGKILAGGLFTTVSPSGNPASTRNSIARLETDGRLDQTLNLSILAEPIAAIAMQADGKILIGGFIFSLPGISGNMARLNTDGTVDTAFNPNVNGFVRSIAVQADGKILVGGAFTNVGGQPRNRIARLDAATGAVDVSFDPNANNDVYTIAVQPDGQILLGGIFTSIGGQTRNRIARLNAATGLADSFNPNANGEVYSIGVQADGKIVVGGNFVGANCIGGQMRDFMARLDPGTGLADSFNPNPDFAVISVVVQADGKILAGGNFTNLGGQPRNHIARLDATSGLPDSFNPNANGTVWALAVQADGKIIAGGTFTSIGGQPRNRLARVDGATGMADSFNPNPTDFLNAIALQGDGKLLAGGEFGSIGGQSRLSFARLSNDTAALRNLTVTQTTINWTQGGSSPQFTRVTFESSNDNVNYTFLGNGAASGTSWTLTGLNLPTGSNVYVRARGYYRSGWQSGSESINETVRNAFLTGPAPTPMTIQFSASNYPVSEGSQAVDINVTRSGDTTGPASVNFATSDTAGAQNCNTNTGAASSRCDYETSTRTVQFAAGETSKVVSVLIVDDSYLEGAETFTVTLSSPSGAGLGSPATATVTITDNDTANGTNPIDTASFFVRSHYLDFLNRAPDASGLAFWTNEITSCGADQQCIQAKRVNVSAAFYLSIEFQQTGYLVHRIYKVSYGSANGTSTLGGTHQLAVPIVRLNEFLPDTQQIGQGVIVGQTGWEQVLDNNKQAFCAEFVQRSRFASAFAATMTPAQFVDALFANAAVTPSAAERQAAIDEFGGAGTSANLAARGRALKRVAENGTLAQQEFNRAFVLTQYFGYLRRNPNDPQDSDYTGYDFWLSKLNQFNGNFVNADMVKAFITSSEYRQRFGP